MGNVDWFLGTHFQWSCSDDKVSVHLSQIVSRRTLSKTTTSTHATSHPRSLPTAWASLSTHVPNPTKPMTAPPSSNASAATKVLLAPLAGWHKAQDLILLLPTPSFRRTTTNHQRVIGMQLSRHYTTSTQQLIMDSRSCPRRKLPSTRSCHIPHLLILKRTPTPSHLYPISITISPPIATLAGGLNSAMPSGKVSKCLYSNFVA